MDPNTVWRSLIALVFALSIWFLGKGAFQLYDYYRLDSSVVAEISNLRVSNAGKDRYRILADYTFTYAGKQYSGSGAIGKLFLNPWSAEKGLQKMQGKSIRVWFNKSNPEEVELEKSFPTKQLISGAILMLLGFYFWYISRSKQRL